MAGLAAGIRAVHDGLQSLEPLDQRGPWQGIFAALVACADPPRVTMIDSSAVKAHRSAAGATKGRRRSHQAIGRSRGGRTTRINALCDEQGRPHTILLTGGNVADITAAVTLVSTVAPPGELVGDKGYDANHLHQFLAERRTAAVIPSTSSRKVPIRHDAERYRLRNLIERTLCRIKDVRGIATRYDKTARNFLAAVCLVSTVTYWA